MVDAFYVPLSRETEEQRVKRVSLVTGKPVSDRAGVGTDGLALVRAPHREAAPLSRDMRHAALLSCCPDSLNRPQQHSWPFVPSRCGGTSVPTASQFSASDCSRPRFQIPGASLL